jgi:hypothetical protein
LLASFAAPSWTWGLLIQRQASYVINPFSRHVCTD